MKTRIIQKLFPKTVAKIELDFLRRLMVTREFNWDFGDDIPVKMRIERHDK